MDMEVKPENDRPLKKVKVEKTFINLGDAEECLKPRERDEYNAQNLDTLRKLCTAKGLKLPKAANKNDRVQKLVELDATRLAITKVNGIPAPIVPTVTPVVKKKHCVFRLLNILFSDGFSDEFATLGNAATRDQLNLGLVNAKNTFWIKVKDEFWTNRHDYSLILFPRPIYDDINPNQIQKHTTEKLYAMWKDVNSKYVKALNNFNVSGTHDNEFWNFCSNSIDVMYLRDLLQLKPGLNDFVEGGLLDVDKFDSFSYSVASSPLERKAQKTPGRQEDPIVKAILTLKTPQKSKEAVLLDKEIQELNAEKLRGEVKIFKLQELSEIDKMLKDSMKSRRTMKEEGANEEELAEVDKDILFYKSLKDKKRSSFE